MAHQAGPDVGDEAGGLDQDALVRPERSSEVVEKKRAVGVDAFAGRLEPRHCAEHRRLPKRHDRGGLLDNPREQRRADVADVEDEIAWLGRGPRPGAKRRPVDPLARAELQQDTLVEEARRPVVSLAQRHEADPRLLVIEDQRQDVGRVERRLEHVLRRGCGYPPHDHATRMDVNKPCFRAIGRRGRAPTAWGPCPRDRRR